MKHILAAATVAVLLAACGSDGGGSSDDPQGEVADIVIEAANDAGASPDAECIREAAARIDTEQAELIVDAGLDGEPDISAETGEILAEMLLC
jgi:hypothetical protein